ncbi:acyl-CoA synthetase, partial [Methanoculleus bourgensis]
AVVIPASGNGITPDDIIAFSRDHLAGYKVPRRVIIADDIPRVNGWKLLRKRLREEYCRSGA